MKNEWNLIIKKARIKKAFSIDNIEAKNKAFYSFVVLLLIHYFYLIIKPKSILQMKKAL